MSEMKPIRLLIAALGGEGGGLLAGWIANAAVASGHFGQRTSIPGVAQRTGATTYYLEILPRPDNTDSARRPVLALNAAPGEVDVMVASELLEAMRAIQAGYVSPDRTLLIASTARAYTVDEKSAMGDGRLDPERMANVARRFARKLVLADFTAAAAAVNAQPNAVLLGAIAGSNTLPIPVEAFRRAIEAEAKAVDANMRGFEAGLNLAARDGESATAENTKEPAPSVRAETDTELETRAKQIVPVVACGIAVEGVRRLVDYQSPTYASLYLDRLQRFAAKPGADAPFIRELARHLAVRMSFEDTIRVAQLKIKAGRVERLRSESKVRAHDLIDVTEFLKPGPEEIFSLLPPRFGRWVLRMIDRLGWSQKSFPMKVRTTRVGGFVRLKALAVLRPWRPHTLRYAEEQAWIERWLGLVDRALALDADVACEVVETARLVKGYGETYKLGHANWNRIVSDIVEPFLAGRFPSAQFADAVLQSRLAALADPDGARLATVIESVRALPAERRIAAE
ncbi:MAG TPA: indolepyruvate oxidoreductase subunit beta family protein [Xanthobacteraceae bacterium]|jgi:indolepyruvate ferredoxin oxidoreductase beta subunit